MRGPAGGVLLFISSVLPFAPYDGKPKRLTEEEKSQLTLSDENKQILVGSLLGDGNINKQENGKKFSNDLIFNVLKFLINFYLIFNVLNDKWNLECYKSKTAYGGYRIAIPRRTLPILQSLIKDIIPSMMLYKIGL